MPGTEIRLNDLSVAAKSLPEDAPIVMINLIKFKPRTTYPEGSTFTEMSGEEAYITRYGGAFRDFAEANSGNSAPSIKPLWLGKPQVNLVMPPHGGTEVWDFVGIVWYSKYSEFTKWVGSEEYAKKALPHRLACLEDYRLYATTEA
jgi:hypothetical protein